MGYTRLTHLARAVAATAAASAVAASVLAGSALATTPAAASPPKAAPSGAGDAPTPTLPVGTAVAVSRTRPDVVQSDPSVAWNGHVFLVVWTETAPGDENSTILAARVAPGGTVLDPGGILVSTDEVGPNPNSNPEVAAGNGRFLVVWEEYRSPNDIRGALVTGGGTVLRQWFVQNAEDDQSDPDVAWNGRQWLVVFADTVDGEPYDIYGTRVRWSGRTLDGCSTDTCADGHGIDIDSSAPGDQWDPAVTGFRRGDDAGLFQVVWTDQAFTGAEDIRGGRVGPDGTPLDGTGLLVSGAGGPQLSPAAASSRSTVLAAWTDGRRASAPDVFGARLRPTLDAAVQPALLPAWGLPISVRPGGQSGPALAPRRTGFLAAWTDTRSGDPDVYAARVLDRGRVLDPAGVPVAASGRVERSPAVATGAGRTLVAYERGRPDGTARLFVRLLG